MNPYETLNIPTDATDAEIKQAFREKAKDAHPDAGGTQEEFARLENAYALLKHPERRNHYDKHGEDKPIIDNNAKAIVMINDMINQMLAQLNPEQIIYENIIVTMVAAINKNRNAVTVEIEKITAHMEKLDKMEKLFDDRIKTKSENNLFLHALNGQRSSTQAHLANYEQQRAILDIAIGMLNDYTFKFDERPAADDDELRQHTTNAYIQRMMQGRTSTQTW